MDMFDIILILAIGYFIGKAHAYYSLAKTIRDLAEENGIDIEKDWLNKDEDADKTLKDKIHLLRVETVNDVLYLYEKDTNDFVCQGSNIDDLATRAKEYKNILLASVLHNDKVFMFVNGTSKEYTE